MTMIGFVLSKMNLLILVIALFTIIAFFTFSLGDVVLQNQAKLIIERYTKTINTSLSSSTYCDRVVLNVPRYLTGFGGNRLFYKLKISTVDTDKDPFNGNFLVFSVVDRGKENIIINAGSIKTDSQVHLYSVEGGTNWSKARNEEGESIELDPQSSTPVESFVLVKKVVEGKKNVFIVPCSFGSTVALICEAELESLIESPIGSELKTQFGDASNFACGFNP